MSNELRDLYQEVIIDHGRHPRNFFILANATQIKEGFNPLCGDRITIYIHEDQQQISDISFQGCGCAISMASASLMTEYLKGKSIAQAKIIFQHFHDMIMKGNKDADLGKLLVLSGVAEYPARVKCATLAWHSLLAAIENDPNPITTE